MCMVCLCCGIYGTGYMYMRGSACALWNVRVCMWYVLHVLFYVYCVVCVCTMVCDIGCVCVCVCVSAEHSVDALSPETHVLLF